MATVCASRSLDLSNPRHSSSPCSFTSPSVLLPQRMPAERRRLTLQTCRGKRRAGAARLSSELVEPLTVSSTDPDLTLQITVGAIAGVTPFIVAGIEFSKRIIQQRRCQVCGGSGLVKRVGILVRCNGCGGFLPWQSWNRFFSSGR